MSVNGLKFFVAILFVVDIGQIYFNGRVMNERDNFERSLQKVTSSYTVRLVADYRKSICGLNVENNEEVQNAVAFTDKDRACLAGVVEKARKEVTAVKER